MSLESYFCTQMLLVTHCNKRWEDSVSWAGLEPHLPNVSSLEVAAAASLYVVRAQGPRSGCVAAPAQWALALYADIAGLWR